MLWRQVDREVGIAPTFPGSEPGFLLLEMTPERMEEESNP